MKRAAIAAIAAAGIAITTGDCDGTGTWTIASCKVDVTYINDTTTADYYMPDTDTNFQQYFVPNQGSGAAAIAVVVTFVNNTGGPASLPTGLVVSFTDRSGKSVGPVSQQ